jgi:hypothetical protein
MDISDKDDEIHIRTHTKQATMKDMETAEQSCNRVQEYSATRQADQNEMNDTLDSERN